MLKWQVLFHQSLDEDEIENVITNLRKYSKALEGVR